MVNRYYTPKIDQFLSVDPDLAQTGQPYAFTGDDPLNATDPLGLSFCLFGHVSKKKNSGCRGAPVVKKVAKIVKDAKKAIATVTGHHTVAFTLSATGGFGIGGEASVSIGITGNGTPYASASVGAGGSDPVATISGGPTISNAQTPQQLGGPFAYEGGSADLGPGIGGEAEEGNGTNNQTIYVGSLSAQFGAIDFFPFPIPFGIYGGESYTWTTP